MIEIVNTERKAIKLAKGLTRNHFNTKRIAYNIIKYTSCQCDCGETLAIKLTSHKAYQGWYSVIVGICTSCGEK